MSKRTICLIEEYLQKAVDTAKTSDITYDELKDILFYYIKENDKYDNNYKILNKLIKILAYKISFQYQKGV